MLSLLILMFFFLTLNVKETPSYDHQQPSRDENPQIDPTKRGGSRNDGPIDPNKPGGPRITLDRATTAFNRIMQNPYRTIPGDLIDKAECVAIVPSAADPRLEFGNGAKGLITCRRRAGDLMNGNWTPPSFFILQSRMRDRQKGSEETDLVLLVMNRESAGGFAEDVFEIGVEAQVAAGPVSPKSPDAAGPVSPKLPDHTNRTEADIFTYAHTRGMFTRLALSDAVIKQDRNNNRDFYGREIDANALLSGSVTRFPDMDRRLAALQLLEALSKVSPAKQR